MNPIEEKHSSVGTLLYSETREHATITKETAVGFAEWIAKNGWSYFFSLGWLDVNWHTSYTKGFTSEELYDLYVESLKHGTVENS